MAAVVIVVAVGNMAAVVAVENMAAVVVYICWLLLPL